MDRRTDGQTDGGDYNIPFAFFKKKRGDNKPPNFIAYNTDLFQS